MFSDRINKVMLIKVKVIPNSKKEEITGERDSYEIKVKEKPLNNMANKAAVALLSSFLKIPTGRIRIIKGAKKRNKIIKII